MPTGVISELAPQNKPWTLSRRLAFGLVRALLASTCDFDSMLNIFGNDGVLGNESSLYLFQNNIVLNVYLRVQLFASWRDYSRERFW